ncbi:hypothetical protein MAR_003503 [Mya arenaria]|uniref:Uncharacterized protein n=1 Tax=Mya arenaria TaxID=6604 RepID=A0ABY7G686_MYAAR|nr:hypothetical protein MAR_003503 [Mya arenaria]
MENVLGNRATGNRPIVATETALFSKEQKALDMDNGIAFGKSFTPTQLLNGIRRSCKRRHLYSSNKTLKTFKY